MDIKSKTDFLGEEQEGKFKNRDSMCEGFGIAGIVLALVGRFLFNCFATDSVTALSHTVGTLRTYIVMLASGVALFFLARLWMFTKRCLTVKFEFSDLWSVIIVVLKHYQSMLIGNWLMLLLIVSSWSITFAMIWAIFLWEAKKVSLPICTVSGAIVGFLVFSCYYLSRVYEREHFGVIGYRVLGRCRPNVAMEMVDADVNKLINESLCEIQNVDFIYLAAVHFNHLLKQNEILSSIRKNNPDARICYMPQFPFDWRILERSAQLDYDFKKAYFKCLVHAAYNAKKYLNAEIKFRHGAPDFRLAIWGTFRDKKSKLNYETIKNGNFYDIAKLIKSGGGYIQQYVNGKEGWQSSYLDLSAWKWLDAYIYLVTWFVAEFEHGTPVTLKELQVNINSQKRVAEDLRIRKIDKLADRDLLFTKLSQMKKLQFLYNGITSGHI